jgi:hypothetical protein
MRYIILFFLLIICSGVNAKYPDGTLVFSNKPGTLVGNIALRSASKAQGYLAKYTHVGIIFGGIIYHSDFPVVTTRTKLKIGERAIFILPVKNYSVDEINLMLNYANSQLGKRYSLRGYRLRNGEEGWCSPFVKNVLNAGGHRLSYRDGFTPDNLLRALRWQ